MDPVDAGLLFFLAIFVLGCAGLVADHWFDTPAHHDARSRNHARPWR